MIGNPTTPTVTPSTGETAHDAIVTTISTSQAGRNSTPTAWPSGP